MGGWHLRIAHQVACGTECGQTGSHDIGAFVVDSLGLLWTCEGFVVSAGVIHNVPSH